MASGSMVAVNHDDVGFGLSQQRVNEGHGDGTSADDQVVGFDVICLQVVPLLVVPDD